MSKVFKAVGNAVSSVVKGVVKAVTSVVKAVVNVVSSVISFVTQPFMGMLGGMPDVPSAGQEAERQQGVLVQTTGSNVSVPVVYGYRKVGGTVVFAETGAANNKYLYVAYVFSEGVVEGLREVFIDDWQLPVELTASLNSGQLVNVNKDRYNGRVQLQWWPGVYFNNVASSPVGSTVKSGIFAEAPSFKDTMDFNGLAVMFARYEWKEIKTQADADSNPFSGNIPQLQVGMLGRRVASLLVDAEQFTYDSAPVRYSTNPAEILLDYLRNPRYGKGLVNDDIDWTTWKRAARKCNQTVTYLRTDANITGPILTTNFVLDTGQTIMSNVKTMLMGFRAYMPYVQGKYKLRIEDAGNEYDILSGSAVIYQTFTKDDIVGNITYTGIDRSAKYNVVAVSYVDPDNKFSVQQVIYPETEEERQIYVNLDGGRENKLEATFPTLTNYAMAKDMARLLFNKSRRQETCSLTVSSKALELEPGDNIRIQSNILNFGTDPWRIVSFKVNDNMTVELNCVRNPDDIYPHVRVGEEDIVEPPYIPKGSIIYYPGSSNLPLVGLVPPTNAVYPSDFISVPTNPGATNPEGNGGGGVGGGTEDAGPIPPVEEPPVTPPVVVPPTNNTPVAPPPPPPFDAVLTLQRTIYTKSDDNSGIFTLVFTQPSAGLYDYSIFWWRINTYSKWNEIKLETKPGAGGEITVSVGPLPRLGLSYEYYIRSYATDNRASTKVVKGSFRAVENQSKAGEFIGSGSAGAVSVTEGWTVPSSQVPTEPWYDDEIAEFALKPKLVGGVPQSTRRISLIMTQIIYTGNAKVNDLLEGVFVYYKYKDDTYWNREELIFPAGYYAGKQVSWDLTGDFGARIYPITGVDAIYSATIFQQYDFIIRLKYRDGTTAKKQIIGLKAPVEINGLGQYDYIAVGSSPYASVSVRNTDIPAGYQIPLLSQQDPTLVYNTAQDLLPNFYRIRAASQESRLTFIFNPPTNNKFRGYRIRYREVIPGADPDFKTVDITTPPGIDGLINYSFTGDYRHSTKYEWMISVLYKPTVGDITDATNCFYCRAAIPFGVPSSDELLNNYFNFETKDSKVTLGDISAAFPAPATIIPQKWLKKQLIKQSSSDTKFVAVNSKGAAADARLDASNQLRLNSWYQLQFQAPNQTFTSLVVYRRVFDSVGVTRTAVTASTAKYFGLGAWEKITIARGDLTHLGSGVYTVNLRGPISPDLFEPKYQVAGFGTRTLYNESYGPPPNKYPYKSASPYLEYVYPYYGLGNNPGGLTAKAEFLFVLDDSGEGAKGLRLTEFNTDIDGFSNNFRTEVDGLQTANIPRDNYVNVADYNTFDAGFSRNINEALTNIPLAALASENWGRFFPRYNSTWTGFLSNYYLANPDGFTVY